MRKIDLVDEKNFENLKNIKSGIRANQAKFYWAVDIHSQIHLKKSLLAVRNKNILEIGCSNGSMAVLYVLNSKSYMGIDISDQAIKIARNRELPNAKFVCADGHHIPAPDHTFDHVIVNSLLHHMNLRKSFPEIYRVLKPEGSLIFKEPLGTNLLFQIYRYYTPSARTLGEKPFDFGDLKLMRSFFELKDISFYGFFTLLSGFFQSEKLRLLLTFVDNVIAITPIKYFFWQFSGIAKKSNLESK